MNQFLALRAFVRVVDTGSFSRASDQLALPRSTVSKLITDLEKHLGLKLIHRTTRALAPTSEGLEYYGHARRLVAELDEVDSAARGQILKPGAHLRVDAPASFANCLLIPALVDFHRQYPDITIALGISDRAVNIVGEGVDCVLRAGKLDELGMIGRKITDLQYITCAEPAYLERMGTPASPLDLQQGHVQAGYFFAASGKLDALVFEQGAQRHTLASTVFSTNDGNGLKEMLLAGLGIGQHFQRVVQPYLDTGQLVQILPQWTRPAIALHVLYPPNRHQNARLKVFIDWLMQTYSETAPLS